MCSNFIPLSPSALVIDSSSCWRKLPVRPAGQACASTWKWQGFLNISRGNSEISRNEGINHRIMNFVVDRQPSAHYAFANRAGLFCGPLALNVPGSRDNFNTVDAELLKTKSG